MIKVKANIGKCKYSLSMVGHADYDDTGKDIVCASASTLVTTLASIVEDLYEENKMWHGPDIHLEPGNALVSCRVLKAYEEEADQAFRFACRGFKLLSNTYPSNVEFKFVLVTD